MAKNLTLKTHASPKHSYLSCLTPHYFISRLSHGLKLFASLSQAHSTLKSWISLTLLVSPHACLWNFFFPFSSSRRLKLWRLKCFFFSLSRSHPRPLCSQLHLRFLGHVLGGDNDDNDASGGAFGSHDDIDFNFLRNKWSLSLKT